MKIKGFSKKLFAFIMIICMTISGLLSTGYDVSRTEAANTTVYFYNSEGWSEVSAYSWGSADGEVLGGWPGTDAAVSSIGAGWLEVLVPSEPTFHVIFFNKADDSQRVDLYVDNSDDVYGSMNGIYASKDAAEASVSSGTEETKVYFCNSDNWSSVNAYVWGASNGEALGGWPGTTAAASSIGEGWVEVSVPANPDFHVIFFDSADDSNRVDVYIEDDTKVYATLSGNYASKVDAENALGLSSASYVYFLNSGNWENVNAYIYGDKGELLGGWPGAAAVPATELGGDWVKVEVPDTPAFSIIFFNRDADSNKAELYIPTEDKIYVTSTAQAYASAAEADEAVNGTPTVINFLNFDGENSVFSDVYAYAYVGSESVSGGWPGIKAEPASAMGDNWYQVTIPANAELTPINVIFSDNGANQLGDVAINKVSGNYVTVNSEVFTTQNDAERSVGIVNETVVYFLNSHDWEDVNCYIYGDAGEALGGWPGADTVAAPELGEKWLKVTVPANPRFNIIFFDVDNQTERTELLIPDAKHVYVTGSKAVYSSQLEAELAEGMGDPSLMTTLHFYNSRNWSDISGYFFEKDENGEAYVIGKGWPGTEAAVDTETGENWWIITVPKNADETPFYAIFNDGINQTEDILIDNKTDIYIISNGTAYPTAAEAEEAAANDDFDDGCEDGENSDLAGYDVTYNGEGASAGITAYEAENAATNAAVLPYNKVYRETIQSEASGRQAVELSNEGDYVEFTLTEPANAFVLRYSMPDNASGTGIDSTLSMYINGEDAGDLNVTSKHAWVYGGYPFNNNPASGNAHRFFDEIRYMFGEPSMARAGAVLPAGTTIRLQKDADNDAAYYVIDFIECEMVAAPNAQPENSLSIVDFGAVADDGNDDRAAIEACIEAAKEQGKEVWIPAGNFDLVEKEAIVANSVTIRGAGMWYSNLNGAGAAFKYQGTSKFYDFAMTGVATVRDDSGDPAGFEGNGAYSTNVTIQNIWMEHMKVGVWSCNTDRMVIQGCRIRNTYADGINLCSGTNNSTVRNNRLRNTGDDCIAIWPWLGDCSGNTISHNTIQVPTLANGVAIYGGGNNVVDSNHVSDTINNGAGIVIGSEFDTKKGYTGTITVKNNLLDRCGSVQTDEHYPIGAIWLWSSYSPMTTEYKIYNNTINDAVEEGILIECFSDLTGVNIQHNTINGATDAIYEYGNGNGTGKAGNMTVSNLTGEFLNDGNPTFILSLVDEDIEEEPEEPAAEEEPATETEPTTEAEKNQEEASTEAEKNPESTSAAPSNQSLGVNTGDVVNIAVWLVLIMLAGTIAGTVISVRRKRG